MIDLKKLKPLGVVLILGCAVLALIICFTADMGVPDRYTPAHDAAYYRQSAAAMAELSAELEEHVLPQLRDVREYYVDETSMRLVISVGERYYDRAVAAIQRDFDPQLFEFVKIEE